MVPNCSEVCRTRVFYERGIAGIVWLLQFVNLNSMANYIYVPTQYNYVVMFMLCTYVGITNGGGRNASNE
jgi:hypothetical protein